MNYFAHGCRFVHRPLFLVGTALPDMLRVSDRETRLRSKRVAPFCEDPRPEIADLAQGIMQHLTDDDWFHSSVAFFEVSGALSGKFRAALPADDGQRPSFLGHIVTEIVLDGVLVSERPGLLDDYYAAFASVDPAWIGEAVNLMGTRPVQHLPDFLPLFGSEQFLRDYQDPARLLYRLNQVMRRVGLSPLPTEVQSVLREAQVLVAQRRHELYPYDLQT